MIEKRVVMITVVVLMEFLSVEIYIIINFSRLQAILEPMGYWSDDNLASGGKGQYFWGSGVASRYLDMRYLSQDFLFHVPVIV